MRIKQTDNPNEMLLRYRYGCVSAFLLTFGVVLLACVFIPPQVRGGDAVPWYVGLPVGFALLAGASYRKHIRLDRIHGRATTVQRIAGVTFNESVQPLDSFDRVFLGARIKEDSESTYTTYYVELGGSETVQLDEHAGVEMARQDAQRIATFLKLPLHDACSGQVIVRAPDSFGDSIRTRSQKTGMRTPLPELPANLQTHIDVSQDPIVSLHVPPAGWTLRRFLSILPLLGFGGWMIWIMGDGMWQAKTLAERLIASVGSGAGALAILGSLWSMVLTSTQRVSITASADRVSLRTRSWVGGRTRSLDTNQIDDVFVNRPLAPDGGQSSTRGAWGALSGRGVAIRTKQRTIAFGNHLTQTEQQFLCRFLRTIFEG